MAHNPTITLTAAQKDVARQVRSALTVGQKVTVEFVKRDNSESVVTGTIHAFVGENDKEAMTLVTDKGFRSVNLWAVKQAKVF